MGLARDKADGIPSKATVAATRVAPRRVSLKERFARGTVEWSKDFERVMALPRRPRNDPEEWQVWADELEAAGSPLAAQVRGGVDGIVRELTQRLKKPRGTQTLREVQALLLWEAPLVGGVLGGCATGSGKTLVGMLMPQVMSNCSRAVLLLPPDLRPQFFADWESYGKHWQLPNLAGGKWFTPGLPVLHVVAYSELSHAKSSNLLEQINPDLVMGDEIDALRNDTARVRRFKRFFAEHPDTRFCGWSATLVSDSIENIWHLLGMALDVGSPVPLEHSEVLKWARAIDPSSREGYFMPGVLQQLCAAGESIRSGFQRRLVGTPGVICTEENALGIPLVFRERKVIAPKVIADHLKVLRRKSDDGGWKRPDGEELRTPVEVAACARQLAEGFYLFWRYPHGEPAKVIDLWFDRRQAWNRELRAVLQNPQVHMDSPRLCENAAERYYRGGCPGCSRGPRGEHEIDCREKATHPLWPSYTWAPWIEVENTVYHVTEAKWESDWLLEDAAAWAREAPGIIWVDHPEFGHRLAKMTGLIYYGAGKEAHQGMLNVDGAESIICSINSHKKGKNLQAFSRNLIVSFPASNDILEQAIGRSYRSGQSAAEVTVDYYLHTSELEGALDTAKSRARFVFETMGTAAKLVYGKFSEAA